MGRSLEVTDSTVAQNQALTKNHLGAASLEDIRKLNAQSDANLPSLEVQQSPERKISDEQLNRMSRDLGLYMHPGEDDSAIYWGGVVGLYQSNILKNLSKVTTQEDLDFLKKSYKEDTGGDLGKDLDGWFAHGWYNEKQKWHDHLEANHLTI